MTKFDVFLVLEAEDKEAAEEMLYKLLGGQKWYLLQLEKCAEHIQEASR